MNALLENPEIRSLVSPISVEEYHTLPERNARGRRTELIQGTIIEQMPKSPLHSWMLATLYKFFLPRLEPGYSVWQEQPLTFIDSEPEPDISIVAGSDLDFIERHPATAELVIEIAITTLAIDRAKLEIYAAAGVKECWIILPGDRKVEVYRDPASWGYRTMTIHTEGDLRPLRPSLALPLTSIFPPTP